MLSTIFLSIAAYAWGSIPIAYLVVWAIKGEDIRSYGSGSVSGSNVGEVIGKGWTLPVGIADIFKGAAPVWIAQAAGLSLSEQMAVGIVGVVGHNWSMFLGFQGGRGQATIIGVLLAAARLELLLFTIIALFGYTFTSNVPVWMGISTALLPFWSWLLHDDTLVLPNAMMAGLLFLKRLTANWEPMPKQSWAKVLVLRFVLDRDTTDRKAWVHRRAPDSTPTPPAPTPPSNSSAEA
ncbi:MAG: glycerol-3-phosphate acyltransferase [Chloroflexi bacterium]|nr:glycerol-3-phosphate acyltransferase [Chloroflexota bacterium]